MHNRLQRSCSIVRRPPGLRIADAFRLVVRPVLAMAALLLCSAPALAWGPHVEIAAAALKVLDKDDPFLACIGRDTSSLAGLALVNDWAHYDDVSRAQGMRIYARDYVFWPGRPTNLTPYKADLLGHGLFLDDGSHEAFFARALQAMRTETAPNAVGWIAALTHLTQDTGAPPHASEGRGLKVCKTGLRHGELEGWLRADQIAIAGYKPRLLGKTDKEALAAYLARMKDLQEFAIQRARRAGPLVDAEDRKAVEPILLESALECSRALADLYHTLGALHAQHKPAADTGRLAGTITPPPGEDLFHAKVVLEGTTFSTLADARGRYEFRNLPATKYNMRVMMPRCKPAAAEVSVAAGAETARDFALEQTGNLLRNGDFSVRWMREGVPDGFREVARSVAAQWWSERVIVKPGTTYRLSVKWKKGAQGEAVLLWQVDFTKKEKDWEKLVLKSPAESVTAKTPPSIKKPTPAVVIFHGPKPPWEQADSVSVTEEK